MPPVVEGSLLTIAVNKQNPIEFDFNEIKKIISVKLSGDIVDSENNIPMSIDQTWKYAVIEETDEKAFVEFKTESTQGSVSLTGVRSYSIGSKIGVSFDEAVDYQFIKWDYDDTVLDVEDPKNKTAIFLVKEKTDTQGLFVKPICAPRPRVTEIVPVTNTTTPSVSKDSQIEITFNSSLPQDEEGLAQLQNIFIGIGDSTLKSYFATPSITGKTVIFAPDNNYTIPISKGQTKRITVTVPADFYYVYEDGTKVTYGGNGYTFDYVINDTTTDKARITFSAQDGSGTIEPGTGPYSYSIGEEVNINFNLDSDYEFQGWVVKQNGTVVPENQITIEDTKKLSTRMIIQKALTGVTVEAQVRKIFKIHSITPEYSDSGVNCDTPIVITFNKDIDENTINLSRTGTIKITEVSDASAHYENYFEQPVCTGNTVTITPKFEILEGILGSGNLMKSLMITLDGENIKDSTGDSLQEKTFTHPYRINRDTETIPPTFMLHVFKPELNDSYVQTGNFIEILDTPVAEWGENQSNFEIFMADVETNHINNVIYFDSDAFDSGSGFNYLSIQESYLGEFFDYIFDPSTPVVYEEKEIYTTSKQTKETYTLKSLNDGFVCLDFTYLDKAGNHAKRSIYVYKDTTVADTAFSPKENKEFRVDAYPLVMANVNDISQTVVDTVTEITTQYPIPIYRFHNNEDVKAYMIEGNQTTRNETLTFEYSKVNDSIAPNFISTENVYKLEYGYSKEELTELHYSEKNEDYIQFSFTRDITKNCIVKITITDVVGNIRSEYRLYPCQVSITGDVRSHNNQEYIYQNNDHLGNYYIPNISNRDELEALGKEFPGFDIVYYTFQPDDTYEYRIYSYKSYKNDPVFYTEYFYNYHYDQNNQMVSDRINDNTFTPNGTYEMYVLPVFKYGTDFYYGTVAHGYFYHNTTGTIQSTDLHLPNDDQFSCDVDTMENNLGYRNAHLSFNNFSLDTNYEYGSIYKKDGETKGIYGNLDFMLPSGYKYNVYLYQKASDGKIAKTTTPKVVDLSGDSNDNIPPTMLSQQLFEKYKNDQYLKYPDVNKLYLNNYFMPTDNSGIGLKHAEGYSSDYVQIEYCLTSWNGAGLKNLTEKDLSGRDLKKVVFNKNADHLILDFDDFYKENNNNILTIKLTDNNGNYSLVNLKTSLYSNFKYSAEEKIYTEGTVIDADATNKFIVKNSEYKTISAFGLLDDGWKYLTSSGTFYDSNSGTSKENHGASFTYTEKSVLEDVEDNYSFISCRLLEDSDNNRYTYFCSEIRYMWLPGEILKNSNFDLSTLCKNKTVLPALGGGFQINYDWPCFVHTMAYPTDKLGYLAELKAAHPSVLKEDYQVWESVCSEYGLKLLKNSSLLNVNGSSSGSGLENITVSYYPPLSEIPADYSYVTIVHFADGTVVMSDVKQK